MMLKDKTLITITRQFGSGGREIAEIIAKKLGIRRYDRKIVAQATEALGRGIDINDAINDSYRAPTLANTLVESAFSRVPEYNRMYIEQAKTILNIANQESAVFLGRCADYILKDAPNHYSFFIYADDEFRTERAKTYYGGMSLVELNREDKKRRQYYAYYTGQKWGEPQNYDVMINTSKMTLEQAADLIIHYIQRAQQ